MKKLKESMTLFNQGIKAYHPLWQPWLALLVFINFVWPWFYLALPEARWTLLAGLSAGILGHVICYLHGFTRLMGLMHLPWILLIPFLFFS